MNHERVFCANCSQIVDLKTCKQIYICGDTYICSKKCSEKRFCELKNIDPELSRPHTWPLINSEKSNSIFNSELISKTTKNPLSNVNKEIFKSQPELYDVNFEKEESVPLIENIDIEIQKKSRHELTKKIQKRDDEFCHRCFIVSASSLCAVCIIIISTF